MMTTIQVTMVITTMILLTTINPVKMSMTLLILSSSVFMYMFEMSGSSWFPLILYMLFMGGILIVFMILSSVMPNEKSGSNKISKMTMVLKLMAFFTLFMSISLNHTMNLTSQMKWLLSSHENIAMMIILIMFYFFVFVKILSSEKISLRTQEC